MRSDQLFYSTKGFLFSLIITAALLIILVGSVFAPLYLLIGIVFMFPLYMQLIFRVSGPLPALLSVVMTSLAVLLRINLMASVYAFLYLLIPSLIYAACLYLQLSLEKTVLWIVLGYSGVVLILYTISFQLLGNPPFDALSKQLIDGLSKMPERDGLLSASYQYGLLSLPASMADNPLIETTQGGLTFAPDVLSEFYKQIFTRVNLWLRALVPSLISSYSIYLGLGGLFLSNYYGKRQAQRRAFLHDTPLTLNYPAYPEFSKWFIPKRFVVPLWIMGGVSLVSRLILQPGIMLGGSMLYNIFASFFSIQGVSYVNHIQKQKGTKPIFRGLTIALLMIILPQAALILGIFDELSANRKNKEKSDQNKFDNRREQK